MKRLAIGIVFFLFLFSVPAPGSATLLFLSKHLSHFSLNEKFSSAGIKNLAPATRQFTQKGPQASAPNHIAPQHRLIRNGHLLGVSPQDGGLLGGQIPFTASPPSSSHGRALPAAPELAEWLLMLASFALSGVALRNRRSSLFDERYGQIERLRTDAWSRQRADETV